MARVKKPEWRVKDGRYTTTFDDVWSAELVLFSFDEMAQVGSYDFMVSVRLFRNCTLYLSERARTVNTGRILAHKYYTMSLGCSL